MKINLKTSSPKGQVNPERSVLLLHGLETLPYTMSMLARRFSKDGWYAVQYVYPSHKYSLYQIAKDLEERINNWPLEILPTTAVGFSMGGVILAEVLKEKKYFKKVVFLGSPLLYSKMAKYCNDFVFARTILGPALSDLATERRPKISNEVKSISISATGPFKGKLNFLLDGADDGLVQKSEAHPDFSLQTYDITNTSHLGLVLKKEPYKIMKSFLEP